MAPKLCQSAKAEAAKQSRQKAESSRQRAEVEVWSFVFIDILALFPRLLPAGADPEVWGLRCPERTGQDNWYNLTELRLRRNADVQKQRLRQPRRRPDF